MNIFIMYLQFSSITSVRSLFAGGSNTRLGELHHIPDRGIYITNKRQRMLPAQFSQKLHDPFSAVRYFDPLNLTKRAPLYNIFIRRVLKTVYTNSVFQIEHNFDLQWLMICFTTRTLDQSPAHLPEQPKLNESQIKIRLRHEEGHVCNLLLFVVSIII